MKAINTSPLPIIVIVLYFTILFYGKSSSQMLMLMQEYDKNVVEQLNNMQYSFTDFFIFFTIGIVMMLGGIFMTKDLILKLSINTANKRYLILSVTIGLVIGAGTIMPVDNIIKCNKMQNYSIIK